MSGRKAEAIGYTLLIHPNVGYLPYLYLAFNLHSLAMDGGWYHV